AQLMQIERHSPRGEPHPFVHYRRRFVERAEMYPQHQTLVALNDGKQVAVSSIIIKETIIGGESVKIAYSFDTRVLPSHRQKGIGHAMVEAKLQWAKEQGAVGVYSLIVTTNKPSLAMVAKSGYEKVRMILYVQFQPYPLIMPLEKEPNCTVEPGDYEKILAVHGKRDLFVPNMAQSVAKYDYQRWWIESGDKYASMSLFNQAQIYFQIPADDPWPKTENDVARYGRNLQLFDIVGMDEPELLYPVFQRIRDNAVVTNVNRITWLLDRSELIPRFVFDEAAHQKDYWLLYRPFNRDIKPNWTNLIYLDPRDL
ncbi:MAG TPA: GNAT family N-acetyltransferase, partial [Aggregatilineales bacterium]|nr:GNAT family N-acetyltransferase [Aggregatilineales bacterium]